MSLAAFLLESLEGFIGRGDAIAENLADAVHELNLCETKIDAGQLKALLAALPKLREAGEKLLESELVGEGLPNVIDAGVSMVESGMLNKSVVAVRGDLGKKSAETSEEVSCKPVEPIGGLFATLRATKTPSCKNLSVSFSHSQKRLPNTFPDSRVVCMHELSIANSLVEIASEHAIDAGAEKIKTITLRIGALSCVHQDALQFSFELITKDTMLEGALLEIIPVPVTIFCSACDQEAELPGIQSFRCPICDTPTADIRSGRELDIDSIEIIEKREIEVSQNS